MLGCLNLCSRDTGQAADADAMTFEGPNQQLEYHRLFGGQLLGQFIQAARMSCPDKRVKSMHAVFAREGRADDPVRYEVTRHHEGRSFATLAITARQSRGLVATSTVSMHVDEDGPEHQSSDAVGPVLGEEHRVALDLIPWETRATDDLNAPDVGQARFEVWMRTPPVDAEFAPALAGYATDLTLIGTALRPLEGFTQRGNGTAFTSAVTSHTLWFHRPFRTDDWFLLRQHSPVLAHGRCFGRGDVLSNDGTLVASYAQEALLRFKQ